MQAEVHGGGMEEEEEDVVEEKGIWWVGDKWKRWD